jgi:uncharacterized protein
MSEINLSIAVHTGASGLEWRFTLPAGTTLEVAIQHCRQHAPSVIRTILIDTSVAIGVWGKVRPMQYALRADDRIELYRALTADPKEARRRRVSR